MASVYYGRQRGDVGFSRVVAVKRMLPAFAKDPQFVAMFLDEAALASRIHHPNVVSTLDLVADGREILIVMEYVHALSLSSVMERARRTGPIPIPIAATVMTGVLAGLHAAHEARGKKGEPLGIVHRDVSPQNVLVGVDGVARIMDFGIAKATRQLHVTGEGQIKGKLSYMAPEQLASGGRPVDRGADVFAAGVVLWGMLAGDRLFHGSDIADTMAEVLGKPVPPLSRYRPDVPADLEAALGRALQRDRDRRWPTARAFEEAIAAACPRLATQRTVGAWVEELGGDVLAARAAELARIEGAGDERSTTAHALAAVSRSARLEAPEDPGLDDPTLERLERDVPPAAAPMSPADGAGARDLTVRLTAPARRPWRLAAAMGVVGIVAIALGAMRLSRAQPDHAGVDGALAPTTAPSEAAPSPPLPTAPAVATSATSAQADERGPSPPASAASSAPVSAPAAARPAARRPAASVRSTASAPRKAPDAPDPGFFPERP
jgi:serine/threonine-protein kinase